ncbi:Hypothetical predicted protein [Olea europaea subsp. europaea]|uniref:Uncharacterized protein n=1 Tax=Olea europaea subsp. europaea TaxID=158383 RepID=A0A8S0U7X0_OLEEU|nr:Hypothetical predicted protein [Olea europaea subsp. europaea]
MTALQIQAAITLSSYIWLRHLQLLGERERDRRIEIEKMKVEVEVEVEVEVLTVVIAVDNDDGVAVDLGRLQAVVVGLTGLCDLFVVVLLL